MRLLSASSMIALGLFSAVGASAQSFSGVGPVRTLVLPSGPVASQTVPVTDAGSFRASPNEPGLRRLASIAAPLRLWGENGDITLTLYATEAEARAGGRFQLGYLAAISVLPDVSTLTVELNGKPIGTSAIDGARGLRKVDFEVPAGMLAHGFNAIRVTTRQRHRVDCSIAATYELWTQIDPETTGFLSQVPGFSAVIDLAAARFASDGAMPIRLLQTGDRLTERGVERLLGALQSAVLAGRFLQPSVDFGAAAGAGDGFALAVGSASELAGKVDLAPLGPVRGPVLGLLPGTAERRPILVATGTSEADVGEALAQLARLRAAPADGSPQGLRALADREGRAVDGGQSLSLADLGFGDAHVATRTHRIAFDLALPHDVLFADYDRLTLDLDTVYPAGLLPGAQINVEINGSNAGSAPLASSGGETGDRRSMFLPLRLMRPGSNRIAIIVELPNPGDRSCTSETDGAERLTLNASTRLTIPPLARIARQPELAETLAAGFPYGRGSRRPTLLVPAPDRDSMASAATFAARLGLAAGEPIPFSFAASRSAPPGPTIVVSPARLLDRSTVVAAGLDPQAVRDAWAGREDSKPEQQNSRASRRKALQRDAIPACRARAAASSQAAGQSEATSGEGLDLGGTSAVMSQGLTGPAPDDLVTLVTAPSAAALREAVDCLVHPRVWSRFQGQLAVLSASDGSVVNRAATSERYVATTTPSVMNLRRVAAGWLSIHSGLYAGFALLIAGCLAGSTQLLVRNLGRRSK